MRKRSKYRPRHVIADPLNYVLASNRPVMENTDAILVLKTRNHGALAALVQGKAKRDDMNVLTAMSNITEALLRLGFGEDYAEVCVQGRMALIGIIHRAVEIGRYTPTGPEIQQLNTLMELHDAQLEVTTVRDVEQALAKVTKLLASPKQTIQLPTKGLPA